MTPVIRFDSVPDPLKLPADLYLGEVSGIAVNSKGHIFVLSRGNTTGPAYAAAAAQLGAQMKVTDFSKYRGKRALVLIGTDDVDHPRELDVRIADWLNENGANADFWFLGDRGVSGNGHMMMIESNSDAVAKLVLSWVEGT